MINLFTDAFRYVINDSYFWLSMAFTTSCGVFVGSVLYDGVLREIKKAVVVLGSYAVLLVMTTLARVLPIVTSPGYHPSQSGQPMAGVVTILLVTTFYLFGIWLGVFITKKAHKGYPS